MFTRKNLGGRHLMAPLFGLLTHTHTLSLLYTHTYTFLNYHSAKSSKHFVCQFELSCNCRKLNISLVKLNILESRENCKNYNFLRTP